MPPKKSKTKIKKNTNDDIKVLEMIEQPELEDVYINNISDEEELPEYENVNNKVKEKYEYKPVINKEIIFLHPKNRKTSEIMTSFEFTNVISIRARQIELGGSVFTDVDNLLDPIKMAEKEVRDKKCPLGIIRHLSENIAEKWQVNEMGIPEE